MIERVTTDSVVEEILLEEVVVFLQDLGPMELSEILYDRFLKNVSEEELEYIHDVFKPEFIQRTFGRN